jgi:hypothetical protein
VFGWAAADVQAALGWPGFFAVSVALGLPGLVFAWLAFAPSSPAEPAEPAATDAAPTVRRSS